MLLLAHDVITKNDKTEIKAKGVKILSDVIKYSEWDNQNGPLYNIPKSQVFMITYQNGKKNSYKIGNYANNRVKDLNYTFKPRDKNQPKSKTNYADRFGNIELAPNTIGKLIVPSVYMVNDIFFMPNIAFFYYL